MKAQYEPLFCGVTKDKVFFSSDAQAGRPCIVVIADRRPVQAVEALCRAFEQAGTGAAYDVLLLVNSTSEHAFAFSLLRFETVKLIYCLERFFQLCAPGGQLPLVGVLDRNMRIVATLAETVAVEDCVRAACGLIEGLPFEAPREVRAPAPVLMLPHLLDRSVCDDLIADFEASDHVEGGMASIDAAGNAIHKIDAGKKKRRDHVLIHGSRLYAAIVDRLRDVCLVEMKKAFQYDALGFDRLLVARYDEPGGFFRRHRDNVAAAVAFRRFALSVNLNPPTYEGGHLLFPEYNDHRYRPGQGDAIVFSASLLHEVAPVTRGSRYVLLTFFHSESAQASGETCLRAA